MRARRGCGCIASSGERPQGLDYPRGGLLAVSTPSRRPLQIGERVPYLKLSNDLLPVNELHDVSLLAYHGQWVHLDFAAMDGTSRKSAWFRVQDVRVLATPTAK